MPENDLSLLIDCAKASGRIALGHWRNAPKNWEKPDGSGPVTDADLAVNDMLTDRLRTARPDYGWLSEESEDSAARQPRRHTFIIDPIDGTRSFIAGEKTWAHSLAVADRGLIVAGVIYLPALDKMYSAFQGGGAYLNGEPISASGRHELNEAAVLCARINLAAEFWRDGPPPVKRHFRASLAYRMALVAEGRFDAMLTFRDTWEWDIAAGTLIATEAGAIVSDRFGKGLVFNNPRPKLSGLVAGTPDIHAGLIGELA